MAGSRSSASSSSIAINIGLTGTRKLYLIVPTALLIWFILLEKNRVRQSERGIDRGTKAGPGHAAFVLGAALVLRVHTIGDVYDDSRLPICPDLVLRLAQSGSPRSGDRDGGAVLRATWIPERLFIETLPAKTVFELQASSGWPHSSYFIGSMAIRGFSYARRCREEDLRSVAMLFAIYLATLMLTSNYGWPLDLDPANVTSWLSAGLVGGMPLVASKAMPAAASARSFGAVLGLSKTLASRFAGHQWRLDASANSIPVDHGTLSNLAGWIASYDGHLGDVLRDHGSRPHDRPPADGDARHDRRIHGQPGVVTHMDWLGGQRVIRVGMIVAGGTEKDAVVENGVSPDRAQGPRA